MIHLLYLFLSLTKKSQTSVTMGDGNDNIDWPTDPKSFDLIGKIGQGAFASVWRANDKCSNRQCAIKVLNLDHVDSNLSEIRLEVQAMRLSRGNRILDNLIYLWTNASNIKIDDCPYLDHFNYSEPVYIENL